MRPNLTKIIQCILSPDRNRKKKHIQMNVVASALLHYMVKILRKCHLIISLGEKGINMCTVFSFDLLKVGANLIVIKKKGSTQELCS